MSGWQIVILIVGMILLVGAFMYVSRLYTNSITPIVISEPAPGVKCASMVTGDGVALHCDWK